MGSEDFRTLHQILRVINHKVLGMAKVLIIFGVVVKIRVSGKEQVPVK